MPNEVLRVQNCSERNVSLSLVCDGVDFGAIFPGESVSIQKAPRNLKMIGIQQYSTMRVLQRKMKMQNF
jgi:NAD kinase